MASRRSSSTSRRSSGRSRSSSNSSQMPMVLAGVGVLALILLLVVFSSSSSGDGDEGNDPKQQPERPAAKAAHQPSTSLSPGTARAGKTPDRPAPPLSMDMLEKARGLLQEAKVLNNEGVRLRNTGKNQEARQAQSDAKKKIDVLKKLIEGPSDWQAEAEVENWAQPAEYGTLSKLWGQISNVENRVRKGGGTR